MQVTCSGTKDVLWVGVGKHGAVEKDQAKQGQWSQTELPSDDLGLFASNSSQMVTVLRATYSAQKPKNIKFNSNFFGLALNNRLMAYEYVCTYSTYGRPTTTPQFQLSTKTYTKM